MSSTRLSVQRSMSCSAQCRHARLHACTVETVLDEIIYSARYSVAERSWAIHACDCKAPSLWLAPSSMKHKGLACRTAIRTGRCTSTAHTKYRNVTHKHAVLGFPDVDVAGTLARC
jgi:hypothetical protein